MNSDLTKNVVNSFGADIPDNFDEIIDMTFYSENEDLIKSVSDNFTDSIYIIKGVKSLYEFGNFIKERHMHKKLVKFLQNFNEGSLNQETIKNHKEKLLSNPKTMNKEISFILIVLDRMLEEDKAEIISILYLSYIDEHIKWNTFQEYSFIIDNLYLNDIDCLKEVRESEGVLKSEIENEAAVYRLVSLGLLNIKSYFNNISAEIFVINSGNDKDFNITSTGEQFLNILGK